MTLITSCCGATDRNAYDNDCSFSDIGVCPECLETGCEFVEEDEDPISLERVIEAMWTAEFTEVCSQNEWAPAWYAAGRKTLYEINKPMERRQTQQFIPFTDRRAHEQAETDVIRHAEETMVSAKAMAKEALDTAFVGLLAVIVLACLLISESEMLWK